MSPSGGGAPSGALADAIGDFLAQPDEWQDLARAGRRAVMTNYRQPSSGNAMGELFERRLAA